MPKLQKQKKKYIRSVQGTNCESDKIMETQDDKKREYKEIKPIKNLLSKSL